MNIVEWDILKVLHKQPFINQRKLAKQCGHSLGAVNQGIKNLIYAELLDGQMQLTETAISELENKKTSSAVILAAGYGMRMVPINTEVPKGLLEVNGEPLIERLIKQLHDSGIKRIAVVVGFLKEQYEYLIDEYGVELIVNKEYSTKNNLHSLKLALDCIDNGYIIPCDLWCRENPFSSYEPYGWYMVSKENVTESTVKVTRKQELKRVKESVFGNRMIGISYIPKEIAKQLKKQLISLSKNSRYDDSFWEEALYNGEYMILPARVVDQDDVVEINTYEQLRELDSGSNQLRSNAISIICKSLDAKPQQVVNVTVLKKGMTNRSFLFDCKGKRYIMRIPGEGTDHLINRAEEASVYNTINGRKLCDNVIYINPENGYKITEYLNGARVCDAFDEVDVRKCMKKLREFHNSDLKVSHTFDIFEKIDFYESLWNGTPSVYKDYSNTKQKIMSLKKYIDENTHHKCLTHIDAVPDNFLFTVDDNGNEEIRLIDWEYAGMQDPYVDIAMFCIYSMYDKEWVDKTIDLYFTEGCTITNRIKIYCYIAACGLLWSNWCEYKRQLGVEFGEYSLKQYRFAKDYYKLSQQMMKEGNE